MKYGKKGFFLSQILLLCFASMACAQGEEIPKSQAKFVRCPNAIFVYESEDKEELSELLIPDKKIVRCSNIRKKKLKNFIGETANTLGAFDLTLTPEFELAGQAQAYSPAFKIQSKPAILEYDSTVSKLTIELIDMNTFKAVEKLLSAKGEVSGKTYLNRSGHFFLKVSGITKDGEGDWFVEVYPSEF